MWRVACVEIERRSWVHETGIRRDAVGCEAAERASSEEQPQPRMTAAVERGIAVEHLEARAADMSIETNDHQCFHTGRRPATRAVNLQKNACPDAGVTEDELGVTSQHV